MAITDTIVEVVKTLIATGRTKFLATVTADASIVFGIWKGYVDPGWQTIVAYGIIALITLGYFISRHWEQTNERLKNNAIK